MYDVLYDNKHCKVINHTKDIHKDKCITCCTKSEVAGVIMMLKSKHKDISVKIEATDI